MPWRIGNLQEHKIREYLECIQHDSEIDKGTVWRNSECETLGVFITFLGKVEIGQWSSGKVGEGESMCPRWFRFCVGQVKEISGATERWKGQVEDLKIYSSYQDAVGLDGEAIEFEWKIVPGFSSLSILHEIQMDLETEHQASKLQGLDHLHVNVQWHWVDKRLMRIVFWVPKNSGISRSQRPENWLGPRFRRLQLVAAYPPLPL